MNTNESYEVCKVLGTTNYDLFQILDENREILETRIKKIRKSFQKKVIRNPIIVNEKMEIIDGQGRFTVLKEMGLPIEYIVVPNTGVEECHLMNQVQTNWTDIDFIKSYATMENQNYTRLLRAIELTDYTPKIILRAAHRGVIAHKKEDTSYSSIKTGGIMFTEEDFYHTIDALKKVDEIKAALGLDKKVGTAFDIACFDILEFPEYDHERMLQKCKLKRNDFVVTQKKVEQLKEFSKVYNYNAKKNLLYFEDIARR